MVTDAARNELAQRLDGAVAGGALARLHGVIVLRGGELVFERYWSDEDEAWGTQLGRSSTARTGCTTCAR